MRNTLTRLYIPFFKKLKFTLTVLRACFVKPSNEHCYVDEPLFLDDNPRFSRVLALTWDRAVLGCHYLDLDSCEVISHDEDGFEIAAKYIAAIAQLNKGHEYACRFRKNKDSSWGLQVRNEHYDKEWNTFIDPHDEDAIERKMEEKGIVDFRLSDYYMFKCVYQHLFGEPYEDNLDDDELRRTVIELPRDGEKREIHRYLWDDENYPCVWSHPSYGAWYVDKSSVNVAMESPAQCILRITVLQTPQFHYNDMMMDSIFLYRFLYNKKIKKMYVWWWPSQKWMEVQPPQISDRIDNRVRNIGSYAYAHVYGESFYKTDS